MEANDWTLKRLDIHLIEYGDQRGQLGGSVHFSNGVKMDLNFKLSSEQCAKYMTLLQDNIVEHAKTLADTLAKSLPVQIKATEDIKQIEATNQ